MVYGSGLENQRIERYREFESHRFRHNMTLFDLTVGTTASIESMSGPYAGRWQSMGIVPGKQIVVLRHGPGKICHCRIGTTEYAINQQAARAIFVKTRN